jgi:hypothetical protein
MEVRFAQRPSSRSASGRQFLLSPPHFFTSPSLKSLTRIDKSESYKLVTEASERSILDPPVGFSVSFYYATFDHITLSSSHLQDRVKKIRSSVCAHQNKLILTRLTDLVTGWPTLSCLAKQLPSSPTKQVSNTETQPRHAYEDPRVRVLKRFSAKHRSWKWGHLWPFVANTWQ